MPDKPCKHNYEMVWRERGTGRDAGTLWTVWLFCKSCGTGKRVVI
jgi:hypothetical protein